jgi:type II secretory pathway component PulF
MGEEKPRIRWWAYVVAGLWPVSLTVIALAVPQFDAMFDEMGVRLPLSTRLVLAIPPTVWIVLGVLACTAMIWASRLFPKKVVDLVWPVSVILWGLLVGFVIIALFGR